MSGLTKLIYRFSIISINFPKGLLKKEMIKFIWEKICKNNPQMFFKIKRRLTLQNIKTPELE